MNILLKILLPVALTLTASKAEAEIRIVPQPREIIEYEAPAKLPSVLKIRAAGHRELVDTYMELSSGILRKGAGMTLVKGWFFPDVRLRISKKMKGRDGYSLKVSRRRVTITAADEDGLWAGLQTLTQILMQKPANQLLVRDSARFGYRGAMLDCGRHFFSVGQVKQFIDCMAVHKLNVFHWHLTEDQGWRIEIKKYPLLTAVGSERKASLNTNYSGEHKDLYVEGEYGGYYTQEDIREIVEYARVRHIDVVPEIEIPGHSVAALASYPELGCTGGPYEVRVEWGVSEDVLCIGKEKTWEFYKDVLDEVCELFPFGIIHIGGDECPRVRWKECPDCQALMAREGMAGEAQLQSWITKKVEDYLAAKGRRIIGWDEVLEGGVSTGCIVMSWHKGSEGGIKAASLGNDVIMTDKYRCYLDCYQSGTPERELLAHNRTITLKHCWEYDPADGITGEDVNHVLGIQGNVWTEHISDSDRIFFMTLPRLGAIAETAWSDKESKGNDYDSFLLRMEKALLPLYDAFGWPYAKYAFEEDSLE